MEKYTLEQAQDEANDIRKKAQELVEQDEKNGNPAYRDYKHADKIIDEKNKDIERRSKSQLKRSFFAETINDNERSDQLEPIDLRIKYLIFEKVESFAKKLENKFDDEDEELKFDITYIAPDSQKSIDRHKKDKKNKFENEAWKMVESEYFDPEKRFGKELANEIKNLEKMEKIEKITEILLSEGVAKETWTNITIYRKKKDDTKIISYYPNLNITADGKIYTKEDGLLSLDTAVEMISAYLKKYIKNFEK